MPKGILLGLGTLVVCAFATLILSTGIAPGATALGTSNEPLFDGFRTIFGAGIGTRLLALVEVAGLVASFHAIIFAYSRQIYSLSRAGYFPPWLSLTYSRRETPWVELVAGAVLGYTVALTIHLLGSEHPVGAVPLNLAVFGAVIALVIASVTLVALFMVDPVYQRVVLGAAVWYALGLLWFELWGRKHLVYSPEERFAREAQAGPGG